MFGSWIGLGLVIILFLPAIIGTIRASTNSCLGSDICNYDEQCSNLFKYWESDDWFNFNKRGGVCNAFEFFCVESTHCEKLDCSSGQYEHIRRTQEPTDDDLTWHTCFDTSYTKYCSGFGHDCVVYDLDGSIIQELTTGNPELVDTAKRINPPNIILLIMIVILMIIGFLIGWGIHSLVRKLKKGE